MHVALAADCRRVRKLLRHRRHGFLHLAPAPALACRRRDAGERFERRARGAQRAKILQRDLHAGDLAQESVHVARRDDADRIVRPAILEHAAPRQRAQHIDRGRDARTAELLVDVLAALGAEFQCHRRAIDRDIGLQQGRGAARAICLGVALAAGADRAARHQLDHRGECELARRLGAREVLVHRAANARQRFDQPLQAPCLAPLAHLFPFRMIAILQAPRRIAADRLDMCARVRRVEHVLVGRWHGQALQPRAHHLVADGAAVLRDEGPALTLALAPDRQCVGRHIDQAEAPHRGRGEPRSEPSPCLLTIDLGHRTLPSGGEGKSLMAQLVPGTGPSWPGLSRPSTTSPTRPAQGRA